MFEVLYELKKNNNSNNNKVSNDESYLQTEKIQYHAWLEQGSVQPGIPSPKIWEQEDNRQVIPLSNSFSNW